MTRLLGLSLLLAGIASVACAGAPVAPEIDATTGVAAMGLVGGGLLILRSRKKK
jgi:LPXTG-motif cell wall-anchored protein